MLATLEPDVRTHEGRARTRGSRATTPDTAPRYEVSVTWRDDGTKNGHWTFDPPESVEVRTPNAQIFYTFTDDSTPDVKFRVNPVLWIEPAAPDNFAVQLTDASQRQISIVDANFTRGPAPESFGFRLIAVYNNRTRLSHDPMIINFDPS